VINKNRELQIEALFFVSFFAAKAQRHEEKIMKKCFRELSNRNFAPLRLCEQLLHFERKFQKLFNNINQNYWRTLKKFANLQL
jgi:hypothetical protein